MPGETLIEWDIYDWVERGPYTGDQGWYWCYEETNPWQPDDHQLYWQYNVFLDEDDWFWQEEGTIYWLYITAILYEQPPNQPLWGWKSTFEDLHFMDDAVWSYVYLYEWLPLTYPTGATMDLAFVINGDVEEQCNLTITDVTGGFLSTPRTRTVDAVLENTGTAPCYNVTWNFTFNGGIILSGPNNDVIPVIPPGGKVNISSKPVIGLVLPFFLPGNVTVTATCPSSIPVQVTKNVRVIILLCKVW